MNDKPRIAIGNDDFQMIRQLGGYYIDKTAFVREIGESLNMVHLYTRPRRFGKSLALSMLANFFDISRKEDNARLYDGLEVSGDASFCAMHQFQYPVIHLSFKELTSCSFSDNLISLACLLESLYKRYPFLATSDKLSNSDKESYHDIQFAYRNVLQSLKAQTSIASQVSDVLMPSDIAILSTRSKNSLLLLCELLYKHYGKKVVILLDEYDVPLRYAFVNDYYDRMLEVVRSMMSSAFKGNPFLQKGVITGCLHISKESIFTGMNNPYVNTILNQAPGEWFGFTKAEVKKLLGDCGLTGREGDVESWYDGYLFGDREVYNPWSILSFASNAMNGDKMALRAYWAATSGNDIVKQALDGDIAKSVRDDIERLMNGGTVEAAVLDVVTYQNFNLSTNLFWTLMLYSGYLKPASPTTGNATAALTIPNHEIRTIFNYEIMQWLDKVIMTSPLPADILKALLDADVQKAELAINKFLRETISIRDHGEGFYHGMMLALLKASKRNMSVLSQREQGDGYPDVIAIDNDTMQTLIVEIKMAESNKPISYEQALSNCQKQYFERRYADDLLDNAVRSHHGYAMAFHRKACRIRLLETVTGK